MKLRHLRIVTALRTLRMNLRHAWLVHGPTPARVPVPPAVPLVLPVQAETGMRASVPRKVLMQAQM